MGRLEERTRKKRCPVCVGGRITVVVALPKSKDNEELNKQCCEKKNDTLLSFLSFCQREANAINSRNPKR